MVTEFQVEKCLGEIPPEDLAEPNVTIARATKRVTVKYGVTLYSSRPQRARLHGCFSPKNWW